MRFLSPDHWVGFTLWILLIVAARRLLGLRPVINEPRRRLAGIVGAQVLDEDERLERDAGRAMRRRARKQQGIRPEDVNRRQHRRRRQAARAAEDRVASGDPGRLDRVAFGYEALLRLGEPLVDRMKKRDKARRREAKRRGLKENALS